MTNAEKLASVQAAIAAIEGGAQSYSAPGISATRADLKTLYERESKLEQLVSRETRGTGGLGYGVPL